MDSTGSQQGGDNVTARQDKLDGVTTTATVLWPGSSNKVNRCLIAGDFAAGGVIS